MIAGGCIVGGGGGTAKKSLGEFIALVTPLDFLAPLGTEGGVHIGAAGDPGVACRFWSGEL